MGRSTSGRDQRGAQPHGRRARLLQALQGEQQRLERAIGQGQNSFVALVLLKCRQSIALKDLLGLV